MTTSSTLNSELTDERIIEIIYPHLMDADGGYVCDTSPKLVAAGVRAVLAAQSPASPIEIHQWRKKTSDAYPNPPWYDGSKEEAYGHVSEFYEARTIYSAPAAPNEPVQALPELPDLREGFERYMSNRGEAVNYAGDGMYQYRSVNDQSDAFKAGAEFARAAIASCRALPAKDEARDAARWRAFVGSARIKPQGSAGLNSPEPDNYAHMGLEIWTTFPRDCSEKLLAQIDSSTALGREWLTKYADVAVAALAASSKGEGK